MKRNTRITLAAAAGLLLSLDAVAMSVLGPPAVRALDSGRARAWLRTSYRVSHTLARAALEVEARAAALAADRILSRDESLATIAPGRIQRPALLRTRTLREAGLRDLRIAVRKHRAARLDDSGGACCGTIEAAATR